MATFKRFVDILAWQKARVITKSVYRISGIEPFKYDRELRVQITRASVSIMANIAEGYGRRTRKEFANHLNIARASAHEVQCLLYVSRDMDYIDTETFRDLHSELGQVSMMTLALAQYLRK